MSGKHLLIGAIVMGILLPLALFFLLQLSTLSQLLTTAAATFLAWGVADLLSQILDRPRLQNRSPGQAWKEDLERRRSE